MGGARQKRFYTDMHSLNATTMDWQRVTYAGGTAPVRAYHSCTLFRGELIFYGGNYPNPDPTPDGCSDDIDIFNIAKQIWYRPLTMGDKPPARSGYVKRELLLLSRRHEYFVLQLNLSHL